MTDIQTFHIVATLIINAVAVIWCIRETFVRHKQTKELQASNANLQSEVHRLSVNLNQEIVRLNRINELIRGMYPSTARLRYKTGLQAKNKNSREQNSTHISIDDIADWLVTFEGSTLEMRAIANVIHDTELLSLTLCLCG